MPGRPKKDPAVVKRDEQRPKYRTLILDYLADPENPPLDKRELSTKVCLMPYDDLRRILNWEMFQEIIAEGLALRRARIASKSALVDEALFRRATAGDVQAIKLWYQRMEGWSETQTVKVQITDDVLRRRALDKGYDPDEYVRLYHNMQMEEKNGRPGIVDVS